MSMATAPLPSVSGRVINQTGDGIRGIPVLLRTDDEQDPQLPVSVTDDDGRFRIAVPGPLDGALQLIISDGDTVDLVVDLLPTAVGDETLVVLPEPTEDPRTHVADVARVVSSQREAANAARGVLADEVDKRGAGEDEIAAAVGAVLLDVVANGGGDTAWKLTPGQSIADLTAEAVHEGRRAVSAAPPAVAVPAELLDDGEELTTSALVARLAGAPQPRDGYWRVDPLERLRLRERHVGPDGLPVSRTTPTGGGDGDGRGPTPVSALEPTAVDAAVNSKVEALVDAMRLPEDPPLLNADSAIRGTGPDTEFARGIADTTAFHDFHEMIPALPDVWQDVFDRRLINLVDAGVRELAAAGLEVSTLSAPPPPDGDGADPPRPADRLLDRLGRLASVYESTSAGAIRPRPATLSAPASAVADGVTDLAGGVLYRAVDVADDATGTPVAARPRVRDHRDVAGVRAPRRPVDDAFEAVDTAGVSRDTYVVPTVPALLRELRSYLRGRHAFTVFAAEGKQRAINFGVLLTWRHEMEPLTYQVGRIAHTITLAPGERRKIVTRQRRSLKRSSVEADKALRSSRSETTDTLRAESELIRKANASTDFHLSAEGTTDLLVSGGTFSTNATRSVGRDGNDTRRRFREAVVKAAQELRNEVSMEVKEESEGLFEEETTAEVHNPNDEVALTAVFYTLQRRYRLRERLYRARPVIMVAMPVPDPSEITTAWLIRHAWILRRCLLDDRFATALDYLTSSFLGDKETLKHLRKTVQQHEKALGAAEHRLRSARALVEHRSSALSGLRRRLAGRSEDGIVDELFDLPGLSLMKDASNFVGSIFGRGDDDQAKRERQAMLLEAVEEDLARAEREAREAESQMAGASNALQEATRDLVAAERNARNHEVRIAECRVHVRDFLLHYMQCIWAHQPPDQRFFELHDVQVPVLTANVRVTRDGVFDRPGLDGITPDRFRVDFADAGNEVEFTSLAQICDLDQPLGFRGNLALFPMKDGNALTDVIIAPYIDEHEVLRDPDDIGASWTLADLEEYADRLRGDPTVDFDEHVEFLRATLERLLTAPRLAEEEIVVPTTSLYVDLLISGGKLLEQYKEMHRALDVEKVREELRTDKLDALRRAARIDERELADPDMDDFERHLVRSDGNGVPPPP